MTVGTVWILALVLVAIVALAAVWKPLFGRKPPWSLAAGTEIDSLLAEKARALRALKDLEQDRSRGLLGEAEFTEARGEYVDKAAALNRAIGAISGVDPAASAAEPPGPAPGDGSGRARAQAGEESAPEQAPGTEKVS